VSTDAADRLLRPTAAVDLAGYRSLALLALGVLTAAYGSVLYHVTDVVGGTRLMLLVLVGTAGLAVLTGRAFRERTALLLTVVFLAGGVAAYFLSVPASQRALISAGRLVSDSVALLTGLSVLRLTQANVWALSVAPPPVFLSWYLAVRRRYVWSVAVGGTALSVFVLTGDAGTIVTLAGVVGAAATLGFGTLDRYGGSAAQVDTLAILLATMVVAAATLSLVPSTQSGPVLPDRSSPTGQASFVDAGDQVEVVGTIRLSPQQQFTVESPNESYWVTGAYDRYTGSGWVRTGDPGPYGGGLDGPPGGGREVRQTVTATTELGAMPAAWRPTGVGGIAADRVRVTPQGTLQPASTIEPGESYTVTSRIADPPESALRGAGTDYPASVVDRYTQLPASTSDRVRERAAEVTADADTPYAKAAAVESYLESSKRYSLTVERPEGSIADGFLFEMDAGYCTYFATTMVTMLRAEGVPARFVTGYTPGDAGDDGTYTVRGLDSHAWVQVYVPDVGWVRFDPTPAGPREASERARLSGAGEQSETIVRTNDSGGTLPAPTAVGGEPTNASGNATPDGPVRPGAATGNGSVEGPGTPRGLGVNGSSPDDGPQLPSTETLALWGVALVGAGAAIRRTGLGRRARRAVWLRRRGPRGTPDDDAVRAFDRLVYLLERRERPRRAGETPRAYVERVTTDPRAHLVLSTYERARYGGGVDRAAAADATDAVGELARERTLPTRPFAR
jgi:transglutaminase-like putative cysteine protease